MPVKEPVKDNTGEGERLRRALSALLQSTPEIMYAMNVNMTYLGASRAFAESLKMARPEDVIGKSAFEILPDKKLADRRHQSELAVLKSGEAELDKLETMVMQDGSIRYYLNSRYAVAMEDGAPLAVVSVCRDATRDYEAYEDYTRAVRYLLDNREQASCAWLLDLTAWKIIEEYIDEGMAFVMPHFETIDEYINISLNSIGDNLDAQKFYNEFRDDALSAMYKSGKRRQDLEYWLALPDGAKKWVHFAIRLMMDPLSRHLMGIAELRDIDSVKAEQTELKKAAEMDSMTGVLNHDAALGHMEQYLLGEGADGSHALLMVDRDGLKKINDTLGHQMGDDVIIQTAKVLTSLFRDTDIIGRVGGDEFLILMKNAGQPRMVRRKAAELLQSLQCICGTADNAIEATGSIGVAFYNGDHKTLDKLYAEADTALYRAKADGRNRYALFSRDPEEAADNAPGRDPLMEMVNLRALLNSIDGGILIFHTDEGKGLMPVFFSDSFLVMMGGLTQEEAFALYGDDLLRCIHPDDAERVRAEYGAAIRSGDSLRTIYRLLGKDGDYRWLSAGTNMTKNPDGGIDVYAVHTNIEKLMHREEKLASDEQRYRMAFTQTSRMLCEVDFATDTFAFYARDGGNHVPESVFTNLPESMISDGFIHEESADAFREFYKEMLSGKPEGKGLFRCRYFSTGQYGWAGISYQMLFDAENNPEKAIGSIKELPNIIRAQNRLTREERLMQAVQGDLLSTIKVNLSRDIIADAWMADDESAHAATGSPYSTYSGKIVGEASYPEDAILLELNLSRESLLEACASGKRWVSVEYRRLDGGEIRWTEVTVCLIEDPVAREAYAFIYVGDVEKRRSAEALLPVTIKRDSVTQLYTQSTTEKLIDGLMRGAGGPERLYSLAMIRIVGLAAATVRTGTENIELEQMYLGRFLSALLDGDCIVGRYGDDSFLVFCPDSQSDEWMRAKIEGAISRINEINQPEEKEENLRLVCGVTTDRARTTGLAGMIAQVARICDAYRNSDTDKVFTFEQYVDTFRIPEDEFNRSTLVSMNEEELTRPLYGSETEALAEAMRAMLASDRYDISVNGALAAIGKYYEAQRVYTLSLLNGNTTVSGMHEWVAIGRHSTLRQMSGVPLDKLPMFRHALAAAKPILLDGRRRNQELAAGDTTEAPWRFIAIPIISESRVQGFLCIENPQRHSTDAALPAALIPMMQHERSRFGLGSGGVRALGRDELTGLPDRSAFESAMQSFNPDAFHAVGALYVSVLDLRELNRKHGNAYGDDMLVFIAQTMIDTFRKGQVFRMSGPEFAAISTNMSREAFMGQCARIRSVLQRRYPKSFCFGESWSSKDASARKLLSEAESLAHNGAEKTQFSIGKQTKSEQNITRLRQKLSDGQFNVLLQPQVDMRTGHIVGAEALARCLDDEGGIILPAEFIHSFEEEGLIRELDYFMLDHAFRALQSWISRGLRPVPISVNFSRQTLLSGTVLASALAIRSRYDVPDNLIEIELTESVGDYEPEPMRAAMEGMASQGFRFSLDDLGSEYSSLKTLGDLSFETVKIDKSLVGGFLYNTMSHSVVESIVALCAKSNMRCIAEGVESEACVRALLATGCTYAQGYYYARPMSVDDFCKKYLEKEIAIRRKPK